MKKQFFGLSLFVAVMLSACGDDSGNSTNADERTVVSSYDDLSNCVSTKTGVVEYVDSVAYVCAEINGESKWVEVSGVEDNPEDFKVCSNAKEGEFAYSQKLKSLYVCKDGAWVSKNDLTDVENENNENSKGVGSSDSSFYSAKNNTLTDFRDGNVYRTTTIAPAGTDYSEVWMAENLNFETKISRCGGGSETTEGDCSVYGRMYTWFSATGNTEEGCKYDNTCGLGENMRGICPKGWHLPSEEEWEALIAAVDGSITEYTRPNTAGAKLKSTAGWNSSGNGTDDYSFSALPAGDRDKDGNSSDTGDKTYFLVSTWNGGPMYYVELKADKDSAYLGDGGTWYSVRCLKD